VSAAGKKIPVFVSPVVVIDGVLTAPAATVSDVADAAPKVGVTKVGVTKVGLVANTLLPVPVLVTLTNALDASVATALEAVKLV
jgi:hypothetical protein